MFFFGEEEDLKILLANDDLYDIECVIKLTVNTSSKVRTASIKTPRTKDVSFDRVVRTLNSVGNKTLTKKEAKILPASCVPTRRTARKAVMDLVNAIARVTCRV